MEGVDNFIKENESNKLYSDIASKFKEYSLGLQSVNTCESVTYNVKIVLYRSYLVITKLSYANNSPYAKSEVDHLLNTDQIVFRDFLNSNEFTKITSFKIHYLDIKTFLSYPFGFYIVIKNSEEFISIICSDFDVKGEITQIIKQRAHEYVNNDIEIGSYNATNVVNLEIDPRSFKNFFRIYDGLKINHMGDLHRIKIGMNDSYIYEILDGKINNKILIKNIYKISKMRKIIPMIAINFEDNHDIKYSFEALTESSFVSHLLGIIEEKREDELKHDGRSLFSLDEYETQHQLIVGIKNNDDFLNRFENKLMNDLLSQTRPSIETLNMLLLNGNFLGKQSITLKKFILKFSKYFKIYFLLKKAIDKRKAYENDLIFQMLSKSQKNRKSGNQTPKKDSEMFKNKIQTERQNYEKDLEFILSNDCKGESLDLYNVAFKIWELLNRLLLNNDIYKEISYSINVSQKDADIFIGLLDTATQILLQEKSNLFSYICGAFILRFIDYPLGDRNNKVETLNKNLLINKKKDFNFLYTITEHMSKILVYSEEEIDPFIRKNIFGLLNILSIFESIIFKKKHSTMSKDLESVLNLLRGPFFFQIFVKLNLCVEPELIYKSSFAMNSIIECLGDKEKVKSYQSDILHHSTLLLRHIELSILPLSLKQKKSSILFIYHCLIDNTLACALMTRLIPPPLFYSVDQNMKDPSRWTLPQWEHLFKNLNYDFNTAIVQWNEDCRKELLNILRNEIHSFYAYLKPLSKAQTRRVLDGMFGEEDFSVSKDLYEQIIQLKWNFEEYDVQHHSLKKKLPIYKYYTKVLLVDEPEPKFSVEIINNPKKFWDELTTAFISINEFEEKKLYLKCLILLYKKYYKNIRETTLISYVIKQLNYLSNNTDTQSLQLAYLYLQMILTLLDIDDQIVQMVNYKNFIEFNGLIIVLNCLKNSYFFSNLNDLNYFEIEKLYLKEKAECENQCESESDNEADKISVDIGTAKNKNAVSNDTKTQVNRVKSMPLYLSQKIECKSADNKTAGIETKDIIFNYSKARLQRESYTIELRKCNQIIICIKIFQTCIGRTRSQFQESLLLTPKPLAKQIAFQDTTMNMIQTLLLLNDNYLLNSILDFIASTYMDKFHFKDFIKNKWIFPLLIYKIDKTTCIPIAKFFKDILNNILATSEQKTKQLFHDMKTLNLTSPINNLKLYSKENTSWLPDIVENYKESDIKEIYDSFPALYVLPPYFWHILMEKGPEEFVRLLYSETYDSPFVLWNNNAFDEIKRMLGETLKPILTNFTYTSNFNMDITKYSFADELVCGPLILKNWVLYENKGEVATEENKQKLNDRVTMYFTKFVENLLRNGFSEKELKYLWISTDVLSNLFKINTNLSFRAFNYIKSFLAKYNDVSNPTPHNVSKKNMHLQTSRTSSDRHDENAIAPNLKNLMNDCLLNCFKLLKNVLKPETTSNNFEDFEKNFGLKYEIIRLFNRTVETSLNKKMDYSFNDLKLNLHFIDFLKNIYEKNGYTINSFLNTDKNEDNKSDNASKDGNLHDLYDIEHIITALDLSVLGNFIEFSEKKENEKNLPYKYSDNIKAINNNKDIKEKELLSRSRRKESENLKKKGESKPNTQNADDIKLSDFTDESEEELEIQNPPYKIDKKDMRNILPIDIVQKGGTKQKFINIKEHERTSFKFLQKKMDYEALRAIFGDFDFTHTHLSKEFFQELPYKYPNIVYLELKKLIHEFLRKWILVVYKLSKNIKNCEKFIISNLALKCFNLSLLHQYDESLWKDHRLFYNINIFAKMCYRVFTNILTFCINNAIVYDANVKDYITTKISKMKIKAALNEAPIYDSLDNRLLLNYYHILEHVFTPSFLIRIYTKDKNYIETLQKGIKELDCFINRQLLAEWEDIIDEQINFNLKNKDFLNYDILLNFKSKILADQPLIGDIYINNYIENPIAFNKPGSIVQDIEYAIKKFIDSDQKFILYLKFLYIFNSINGIHISFDRDFYDQLLAIFEQKTPSTYSYLLMFFIARLKSSLEENSYLLENTRFFKLILTTFFKFYEQEIELIEVVRILQLLTDHNRSLNFIEIVMILLMDKNTKTDIITACSDIFIRSELADGQKDLAEILAFTINKKEIKNRNDVFETFCKETIVHPLIYLNSTKKKKFIDVNLEFLKTIAKKLETSDLIHIYTNKPNYDFMYSFDDVEPSLVIANVNIHLLLNSKDNKFLEFAEFKDLQISIISFMKQSSDILPNDYSCCLSVLSMLLLFKRYEILDIENLKSALEVYIKNPALNKEGNDVMFYQLLFLIPCKVLSSSNSVRNYMFQQLNNIIRDFDQKNKIASNFKTYMLLLSLLSALNREKTTFPFEENCKRIDFAKIMLKLKNIYKDEYIFRSLIFNIICALIMNNTLDGESYKYIKNEELEDYFEIIGVEYQKFIDSFITFNMIDNFPSAHQLYFWVNETKHLKQKPLFPIVDRQYVDLK